MTQATEKMERKVNAIRERLLAKLKESPLKVSGILAAILPELRHFESAKYEQLALKAMKDNPASLATHIEDIFVEIACDIRDIGNLVQCLREIKASLD